MMLQPGTESLPPMRLRIVGRSVFPFFGMGSFDPTGLGTGVQVSQPMPAVNRAPAHRRARPGSHPAASHSWSDVAGVFRGSSANTFAASTTSAR